jgi:hypothetical protein
MDTLKAKILPKSRPDTLSLWGHDPTSLAEDLSHVLSNILPSTDTQLSGLPRCRFDDPTERFIEISLSDVTSVVRRG